MCRGKGSAGGDSKDANIDPEDFTFGCRSTIAKNASGVVAGAGAGAVCCVPFSQNAIPAPASLHSRA